jgi:hypothetical protein
VTNNSTRLSNWSLLSATIGGKTQHQGIEIERKLIRHFRPRHNITDNPDAYELRHMQRRSQARQERELIEEALSRLLPTTPAPVRVERRF